MAAKNLAPKHARFRRQISIFSACAGREKPVANAGTSRLDGGAYRLIDVDPQPKVRKSERHAQLYLGLDRLYLGLDRHIEAHGKMEFRRRRTPIPTFARASKSSTVMEALEAPDRVDWCLREIENWQRQQEDLPSRPEAIRRLIILALRQKC